MRHLSIVTVLSFFCLLLSPLQVNAADKFVVVIDAGHGGGDVGTPHRNGKQDEKTIALNVALKLGKLIEKKYPDVKVVYTRTTDVYPTLPDRTRKARESKGHLFISIHVNAASDSKAHGVETYVFGITGLKGKSEAEQKRIRERTMIERENLDIDGKQIDFETAVDIETKILCQAQREKHNKYSMEVARYVQAQIMKDLRGTSYRSQAHDRGVKQKNIFVLCYSPMPAILVELGYMSNASEEKFMNTAEAQELYASSIFKGFEQYKKNWEKRQLKGEDDEPVVLPTLAVADSTAEAGPAESAKTAAPIDVIKPENTKPVAKADPAKQEPKLVADATPAKSTPTEPADAKPVEEEKKPGDKEELKPAQVELPVHNPVVMEVEKENPRAKDKPMIAEKPKEEAKPVVDDIDPDMFKKEVKEEPKEEAKPVVESKPIVKEEPKQETKPVVKEEPKPVVKTEPKKAEPKKAEPVKSQPKVDNTPTGSAVPLVEKKECYRIQFLLITKHINRGDARLKDLWPVQCYEMDGTWRYTIGEAKSRAELMSQLAEIRKLFSDAFIVHFDSNGQRTK